MSKLYVKLKGDEFAEGEISIDLSHRVTCITGEIDLMRLLQAVSKATKCYTGIPRFSNRLIGISNLTWAVYGTTLNREYCIAQLEAVFEFASTVLNREIKFDTSNANIQHLRAIEFVEKLNEDAQYLINWVAHILKTVYYEYYGTHTLRENYKAMHMIAYPEAFLSPIQQSRLMPTLLKLLPNARFVIATQSPIILSNINPKQKEYCGYLMRLIDEDNEGNPNRFHAMKL
jgi:hypothetical protein